MFENEYYAYHAIGPNKYGLTHVLHQKPRKSLQNMRAEEKWYIVHATGYRFPAEYDDGMVIGIIRFRI